MFKEEPDDSGGCLTGRCREECAGMKYEVVMFKNEF